jgi:hypothetical protein
VSLRFAHDGGAKEVDDGGWHRHVRSASGGRVERVMGIEPTLAVG